MHVIISLIPQLNHITPGIFQKCCSKYVAPRYVVCACMCETGWPILFTLDSWSKIRIPEVLPHL